MPWGTIHSNADLDRHAGDLGPDVGNVGPGLWLLDLGPDVVVLGPGPRSLSSSWVSFGSSSFLAWLLHSLTWLLHELLQNVLILAILPTKQSKLA